MQKKFTRDVVRVLLAVVLFAIPLLFGTSIIKNPQFHNTLRQNPSNIEYGLDYVSSVNGDEYVYIGGKPIGISVGAGGLIVLGECGVQTDKGTVQPSEGAFNRGDVIVKVNGEDVWTFYQLRKIVSESEQITLTVKRKDIEFEKTITPVVDNSSGAKRIGLMLKEDIGGVGTLTFVTQDCKYAALGHHIYDGESGLCEELNCGNIYNVSVDDVIKGEKGKAGGLIASVNRLSTPIGDIDMNTHIGLYGDYSANPKGDLFRIAVKGEARMGRAQVLTTVHGDTPKFYDIDIVKVVSQNDEAEKGMVIAVRDEELLSLTGGIVQGMSGSPIVQDGVLIGAVTHVFISDPTRGYAVHSRFMYNKTQQLAQNSSYQSHMPMVAA